MIIMVKSMKDQITTILKELGYSDDIITKDIILYKSAVTLLYCDTVVSSDLINRYLLDAIAKASFLHVPILDTKRFFMEIVPGLNVQEIELKVVPFYLLNGFVIIVGTNFIVAMETKAILDSGVQPSQSEKVLEGPKDAFTENIETNIGLIRKRLPIPELQVHSSLIGKNSKTKISYCYIHSIANQKILKQILQRLNQIDIDFVNDNNQLKVLLRDSGMPTMYATERPDKAVESLSEGKFVILLNGSPYVLILPMFFLDFFKTSDDYYQSFSFTLLNRIIRWIAFLIAVFLPGIFVAITTHNYDSINLPLLIIFYAQRTNVPFPAFIEALLLIFSFEILRESDIRSSLGNSISILGGLILGTAAVSAGIISPIMIIVVAMSIISGLLFPSTDFSYFIRSYRIILLLLGALFGILGIFMGLLFLLFQITTTTVFNLPYFYPISPTGRISMRRFHYRNELLAKKNRRRSS